MSKTKKTLTELMGMKLYTIVDIMEMMNITHRTVQGYITDKKLPAQKIGGKWYVTEDNLKKFIAGEL